MAYTMGMPPQKRATFDWIGESFDIFKENPWPWVVSMLLLAVPALALVFATGVFEELIHRSPGYASRPASPGVSFFSLVYDVYEFWLLAGIYKMAGAAVRHEPISVGMIFGNAGRAGWVFLYGLVIGLASTVGMFCCIFPYFVLMGILTPGLILVADGESFNDSFNRAWEGLKGDWVTMGLLTLVMGLLVAVSVLACGLGPLVTGPMMYIVFALAARDCCGLRPGGPGNPYSYAETSVPGAWPPPPTPPSTPGSWPPPPPPTQPTWPPRQDNRPEPPSTPGQWPPQQ